MSSFSSSVAVLVQLTAGNKKFKASKFVSLVKALLHYLLRSFRERKFKLTLIFASLLTATLMLTKVAENVCPTRAQRLWKRGPLGLIIDVVQAVCGVEISAKRDKEAESCTTSSSSGAAHCRVSTKTGTSSTSDAKTRTASRTDCAEEDHRKQDLDDLKRVLKAVLTTLIPQPFQEAWGLSSSASSASCTNTATGRSSSSFTGSTTKGASADNRNITLAATTFPSSSSHEDASAKISPSTTFTIADKIEKFEAISSASPSPKKSHGRSRRRSQESAEVDVATFFETTTTTSSPTSRKNTTTTSSSRRRAGTLAPRPTVIGPEVALGDHVVSSVIENRAAPGPELQQKAIIIPANDVIVTKEGSEYFQLEKNAQQAGSLSASIIAPNGEEEEEEEDTCSLADVVELLKEQEDNNLKGSSSCTTSTEVNNSKANPQKLHTTNNISDSLSSSKETTAPPLSYSNSDALTQTLTGTVIGNGSNATDSLTATRVNLLEDGFYFEEVFNSSSSTSTNIVNPFSVVGENVDGVDGGKEEVVEDERYSNSSRILDEFEQQKRNDMFLMSAIHNLPSGLLEFADDEDEEPQGDLFPSGEDHSQEDAAGTKKITNLCEEQQREEFAFFHPVAEEETKNNNSNRECSAETLEEDQDEEEENNSFSVKSQGFAVRRDKIQIIDNLEGPVKVNPLADELHSKRIEELTALSDARNFGEEAEASEDDEDLLQPENDEETKKAIFARATYLEEEEDAKIRQAPVNFLDPNIGNFGVWFTQLLDVKYRDQVTPYSIAMANKNGRIGQNLMTNATTSCAEEQEGGCSSSSADETAVGTSSGVVSLSSGNSSEA
ncbi:unnamed protein product [Amoebophrya sp. A120]|nr:unnamed protein product [Amoebophrya sp. A120]|eukprot:GSA120T00014833001.1